MPEYQHLTDDEILQLGEEGDQPTEEARLKLRLVFLLVVRHPDWLRHIG